MDSFHVSQIQQQRRKSWKKASKRHIARLKECYEGEDVYEGDQDIQEGVIDAAKEKFDEILLLDGCFIIELFRKATGEAPKHENEYVLFSKSMLLVFYHDLFLLENQIPWFVLELLFARTRVSENGTTLVELAIEFFSYAFSLDKTQKPAKFLSSSSKIVHLIDLARRYLCYSSKEEVEDLQLQWTIPSATKLKDKVGRYSCYSSKEEVKDLQLQCTIPSATKLKEAGVTFKKAESGNIFDVKFHRGEGVLEIPFFLIHSSTESIFSNLIAFEQCSALCIPKGTCYAMLLDCLVDTSDDLDLMSTAGIFNNRLNPEEVAKFLNRMRSGTFIDVFIYTWPFEDVNAYYSQWWPKWRASLIHNYFTKPWAIVSVIFAIIVLFFTIMQVFYK